MKLILIIMFAITLFLQNIELIEGRSIIKCKTSDKCPETAKYNKAIYCAYNEDEDDGLFSVKCYNSKVEEVYSYFYSSLELL